MCINCVLCDPTLLCHSVQVCIVSKLTPICSLIPPNFSYYRNCKPDAYCRSIHTTHRIQKHSSSWTLLTSYNCYTCTAVTVRGENDKIHNKSRPWKILTGTRNWNCSDAKFISEFLAVKAWTLAKSTHNDIKQLPRCLSMQTGQSYNTINYTCNTYFVYNLS